MRGAMKSKNRPKQKEKKPKQKYKKAEQEYKKVERERKFNPHVYKYFDVTADIKKDGEDST
jgi:ribosomal protein RSM22 (predicted rRNA methylase)